MVPMPEQRATNVKEDVDSRTPTSVQLRWAQAIIAYKPIDVVSAMALVATAISPTSGRLAERVRVENGGRCCVGTWCVGSRARDCVRHDSGCVHRLVPGLNRERLESPHLAGVGQQSRVGGQKGSGLGSASRGQSAGSRHCPGPGCRRYQCRDSCDRVSTCGRGGTGLHRIGCSHQPQRAGSISQGDN